MVNKNYSIEQPPPILTTFQHKNNTNNNNDKKLSKISKTIDPQHEIIFNNSKSNDIVNDNNQCTTGQHHHVEPNNLTINEIGRFQYILQMDREMATNHNFQSALDISQFDNINIWKMDSMNNNLKFNSWFRQNLKLSIWPVIFLLSCILLACLIFFLFMGNCSKLQISENNNYLRPQYSHNKSKIENLPKFIQEHTTDNLLLELIDETTTIKEETTTVKDESKIPIVNNNSKISNSTQIKLLLKKDDRFATKSSEEKTILKSISSRIPEHKIVADQENVVPNKNNTKIEKTTTSTTTETMIVKVSPTIPLAVTKPTTEYSTKSIDLGYCVSASLGICQGILQYDLTTIKSHRNLNSIELEHFEYLFASKCSKRSAEFVCSALEPECRPNGTLQPCKRICKSILEPCASIIASSEILTTLFDCDQYADSNDRNVCEDPTRRGKCNSDEFSCSDSTCIPEQWKCDNIKDCDQGEDEDECIFCDHDEFQCKNTNDCIPEKYICDDYNDCDDGSDEDDCFQNDDNIEPEIDYSRIYSFATIIAPNNTAENKSLFSIFDYDKEENITQNITKIDTNDYDDMQKGEASGHVIIKIPTNLENFQESKEVMMTSDSENDFKYSSPNRTSTSTESETTQSLCTDDKLRCVSGKCITVDQLCDKITDCPDGADEAMCDYKN